MITVTFVRDVNVTVCVSDLLHVTAHDAVTSSGSLPAVLRAGGPPSSPWQEGLLMHWEGTVWESLLSIT